METDGEIRTPGLEVRNLPLYPLSYIRKERCWFGCRLNFGSVIDERIPNGYREWHGSSGRWKRMVGVEPTASCLASRRSGPSELHPRTEQEILCPQDVLLLPVLCWFYSQITLTDTNL